MRAVKWKRLPLPGSLSSHILPPGIAIVSLLPVFAFETNLTTALYERPDLPGAEFLAVFHVDDPCPACTNPAFRNRASGSSCVRNEPPLQLILR
jgi:hypothetical protein